MKYNETRENSLGGKFTGGQFTKGKFDQVRIHRGAFHIKCIRWKIFEQIGLVWLILVWYGLSSRFLIAMYGIDTAAGVYVEPFQTNMLELFLRK